MFKKLLEGEITKLKEGGGREADPIKERKSWGIGDDRKGRKQAKSYQEHDS